MANARQLAEVHRLWLQSGPCDIPERPADALILRPAEPTRQICHTRQKPLQHQLQSGGSLMKALKDMLPGLVEFGSSEVLGYFCDTNAFAKAFNSTSDILNVHGKASWRAQLLFIMGYVFMLEIGNGHKL